MTILDEICLHKREEVNLRQKKTPLADVISLAEGAPRPRDFEGAVTAAKINVIAEVKKASPSAGVIRRDFDPLGIARQYEKGGASAVSVLTDEKYFQGNLNFIPRIRKEVHLPVLQKDFIVSTYQIYEARCLGADCILLIVKILSDTELAEFLRCASALGLCALVEVHDEGELERALESGARIIGINNRNLDDFSVDISASDRLARRIPEGKVTISESGIVSAVDIRRLSSAGIDAFLIGESLLRSESPLESLRDLMSDLA